MKRVLLIGAGGFGAEIYQWITDLERLGGQDVRVVGVLDDHARNISFGPKDLRVVGTVENSDVGNAHGVAIAVGETRARADFARRVRNCGGRLFTVIHPTAYVAPSASIGEGAIICPFAFVGPGGHVAENTAVNIYASIGHDATAGPHGNICPYATLNGRVVLEQGVFMGTHATVVGGKRVGEWSKIAAGAVVYRDVPPRSLAQGDPARAREMYDAPI